MSQLQTDTHGFAGASDPARGRLFCLLVVAIALAMVAVAYAPGLSDYYHTAEASFHEGVASLFPAKLESAVLKAAHVFLTPWLYLVMMIAWFAERFFPVNPNQKFFSIGMIQDMVGWFVLNSALRIVLIGLFVKLLQGALHAYLPFLILIEPGSWHPVAAVISGLIIVDFLNSFHHYLRHQVPFFWSFHAIHHSQKEMNIFTDLRVHLFEYVVAKPIVLTPLFVLGLSELEIIWVAVILEAYSRLYHANIRADFGPLRYVLVTPQSHRIHHSADPKHRDCNFGVILCIWDRLFGTHWHDHTEYPETGIYDRGFPHEQSVGGVSILTNYIRQFLYPFHVTWNAIRGRGWELDGDATRRPGEANDLTNAGESYD